MRSTCKVFFSLFLIALVSCSVSVRKKDVTTDELLKEIKYLSSDSLKGRLTGSPGDSLAAEFIKGELASYGLIPLTGDGLQRFKVTDKIVAGTNNSFSINGTNYSPEKDFTPMSFSENGSLESEVVFAGYGFKVGTGRGWHGAYPFGGRR